MESYRAGIDRLYCSDIVHDHMEAISKYYNERKRLRKIDWNTKFVEIDEKLINK